MATLKDWPTGEECEECGSTWTPHSSYCSTGKRYATKSLSAADLYADPTAQLVVQILEHFGYKVDMAAGSHVAAVRNSIALINNHKRNDKK